MKIDGVMTVQVYHKDGSVRTVIQHNMIVASGYDAMCDVIGNGVMAHMSKIMVGSGTTDTTASMAALESKVAEKAAVYAHEQGTRSFSLSTDFLEGEAVGALTEAGVFNSDDVMLDRVTFKPLNIDADDRVSMKFDFTFS